MSIRIVRENSPMRRLTHFRFWYPVVWLTLFPILTALAAGSRVADSRYRWAQVTDHGTAVPLSEPALLAKPRALIWRPVTSPAPLVYQPLDSDRVKTGILPYPDVNPRRWQAAPADPSTYHVVWLEQDNRLRCALVNTTGETVRGPMVLAPGVRPNFMTLSLSDGSLLVLWNNTRTAETSILTIDTAGRPGPIENLLSERIVQVTAGLDRANIVHLAWLTSPAPDNWTIYYQASGANPVVIDRPTVLHTFTLVPEESIAAFKIGLDQTHGYLFWSITTAKRPDVERVQVLVFPLDSPADVTLSELILPDHFTPSGQSITTLHVGRIALITGTSSHPAMLRWPRPAPGQQAVLPLAVTLRTPEGWRPAVVYYQHGEALGFQIVAPLPADAGPSGLLIDPSGDLVLAWTGLNNATPHLYTAHTGGEGLVSARVDQNHAALRTAAGGLVGIPLGLLWLVLPVCIVLLAPANTWTQPLTLAVYGAGKLVWPAALFTRLPPLLAATGIEQQVSARWVIEITVLLIGLTTGGVWYLAWRLKRPPWQTALVYPLVDAALTWVIFGANVFS